MVTYRWGEEVARAWDTENFNVQTAPDGLQYKPNQSSQQVKQRHNNRTPEDRWSLATGGPLTQQILMVEVILETPANCQD